MPPFEPVSIRFIGGPRVQRLLDEANGDTALAHDLFVWNVRASGAAMEAIHVFELVFRNAIDRELRAWNQSMAGTSDWLTNPHPYLLKAFTPALLAGATDRARKVAAEKRRPLRHDDVVAQMSFGNWR